MGAWKDSSAKLTAKLPSESESHTTALLRLDGATEERFHPAGVPRIAIFIHANSVFFCCPASKRSVKCRFVDLSFHAYDRGVRLLPKQ